MKKIKQSAKKIVSYIVIFIKRLFKEFQRDQCMIRASGLAFASLFALVPLSTLLFFLFSAIGSFSDFVKNIQDFLIEQLVPTSQEEIMFYIRRFIDNTRALGVAGLLFFLVTSVFLLNAIQNNFNAVWGSRSQKLTAKVSHIRIRSYRRQLSYQHRLEPGRNDSIACCGFRSRRNRQIAVVPAWCIPFNLHLSCAYAYDHFNSRG